MVPDGPRLKLCFSGACLLGSCRAEKTDRTLPFSGSEREISRLPQGITMPR